MATLPYLQLGDEFLSYKNSQSGRGFTDYRNNAEAHRELMQATGRHNPHDLRYELQRSGQEIIPSLTANYSPFMAFDGFSNKSQRIGQDCGYYSARHGGFLQENDCGEGAVCAPVKTQFPSAMQCMSKEVAQHHLIQHPHSPDMVRQVDAASRHTHDAVDPYAAEMYGMVYAPANL